MKHTLLFLCLALFTLKSTALKADYSPTILTHMMLGSDFAGYGEVTSLEGEFFTFKVVGKTIGETAPKTLKVKKYKNWTCAFRWTEYAVGQQVFLFLRKNEAGEWIIMSGGGEGEMPIQDGNVYVPSFYSYAMPFVNAVSVTKKDEGLYRSKKWELYGKQYLGLEVEIQTFVEAVSGLRAAFQIEKKGIYYYGDITQTASNQSLKAYKAHSPLCKWLAEACGRGGY